MTVEKDDFKILEGKNIEQIFLASDDVLIFETDEGLVGFQACGECCSYSWFAHIDGVNNLINSKVEQIENIEFKYYDEGVDTIENNFIKIKTSKGYVTIGFRNSNNGYYTGYLEEIENKEVLERYKENAKPIIDDFKGGILRCVKNV
jgi:hypothetical protein